MTTKQTEVLKDCLVKHAPADGWSTVQSYADHVYAGGEPGLFSDGEWVVAFSPCPDVEKVYAKDVVVIEPGALEKFYTEAGF